MKAFVVDRYKRPLHLAEVAEPEVGPHDVLVDVRAASVNVLDAKIRDGEFRQLLPYRTPLTLGHDLAGVVLRVGDAVTRFSVGDEVFGRPRDHRIGTFAERIAVHQDDLATKPATLSMTEAAALPLVALTAWQALVEVARVQPGQQVLVHAGSGGVGTVAIQLAKHLGATVATTTGTSNVEWVRALGADLVVDYRTQDFTDLVRGYDLALDGQGGENLTRSLGVLRKGGLAIGIAGPPDHDFGVRAGLNPVLRTVFRLLSAGVRRKAAKLGVRYSFLFMRASGTQLAEIAALVDAGVLTPVLDRDFPFEQTPVALAHVETGRAKGKVTITRS
ncbi:NADPH:quinone reductase [Klenkia soli]|uniref:NADPH:quinone reductase n=1 Tax=Klenkia soli TaxID=1052260 RepID=A0A1H0ES67_9ACTN|nr:NADP-dependent oxidoreductase [Klenkia soli]SDN85238.1 NADPH:quinone reductase [Klenkia soli]